MASPNNLFTKSLPLTGAYNINKYCNPKGRSFTLFNLEVKVYPITNNILKFNINPK